MNMKYSIDGIVKNSHKKVCKPVQIQKKDSIIDNIKKIRINHIFSKKNMWFIVFGVVIVIIIFGGIGIFIIKKTNVIKKVESNAISKVDTLNDVEDNADVQESNIFHIVIDTEEFHVDTDIIEGETDDDLHRGVVHQKGSAFPSQYGGNVVITGHRWYPGDGEFSTVFENMDKLKKGDKITIEYKNKKYIYSVDSWAIVETTDTKLLEHTTQAQLTIYTCHPKFSSDQRLVYTAKLSSVEDIE